NTVALSSPLSLTVFGPAVQPCMPDVHPLDRSPIVVTHRKNRHPRRIIFVSILQAAWRENGALAPAAPGRAPSHKKPGPQLSYRACGTYLHGVNATGNNSPFRHDP